MADFKGSKKDFRKYIGPRCRNIVNAITVRHRKCIGKCQECGSTERLDSAHIADRSRILIIDSILEECSTDDDGDILVSLEVFEERFKAEHRPVGKIIRVLCKDCHDRYDKGIREKASAG